MSETLLPPNASSLEIALDDAIGRTVPVPIADLWNPETCPAQLLPWLAHAMSVDEWDPTWPIERRRQIVRDTVLIHRRKGTFAAVRQAVVSFGYGSPVIVEGMDAFLFDGSVFHDGSETYGELGNWAEYRVYLGRPISIDQAARLVEILDKVAPARCSLVGLNYQQAANIYDGTWVFDGSYSHGVV